MKKIAIIGLLLAFTVIEKSAHAQETIAVCDQGSSIPCNREKRIEIMHYMSNQNAELSSQLKTTNLMMAQLLVIADKINSMPEDQITVLKKQLDQSDLSLPEKIKALRDLNQAEYYAKKTSLLTNNSMELKIVGSKQMGEKDFLNSLR